MLRILPIRLLLAFALPGDLGGVRSTTRSSVPPGVAQTSVHAHWLPFPLVPSSPGQRGHDKTLLLPHCAPIAALRNLPSRYPQTLFAGRPGDNRILVSCLHLPDSVSLC